MFLILVLVQKKAGPVVVPVRPGWGRDLGSWKGYDLTVQEDTVLSLIARLMPGTTIADLLKTLNL